MEKIYGTIDAIPKTLVLFTMKKYEKTLVLWKKLRFSRKHYHNGTIVIIVSYNKL